MMIFWDRGLLIYTILRGALRALYLGSLDSLPTFSNSLPPASFSPSLDFFVYFYFYSYAVLLASCSPTGTCIPCMPWY